MIDLKRIFDTYNICAIFTPGFLFICILFFLEEKQDMLFQQNNTLFITLIVILASVAGFFSATLIKIVEQCIWKRYKNPTLKYFKKEDPKLYKQIRQKYGNKEVMIHIKAMTRSDEKLLWKNINYGFFRNSILLAVATLPFSYASQYFCYNLFIIIVIIAMTVVCTKSYAHQALESYKEKTLPPPLFLKPPYYYSFF